MSEFDERFLSGRELFGDDFEQRELEQWFADEREAYASLHSEVAADNPYGYHALNVRHGYRYLPESLRFRSVLGIGSGRGKEFEPIVHRIEALTILEPSTKLRASRIGHLHPTYVSPVPDGTMPFADGSFDLVVCLGVLHHIPNVSKIVREVGRVLEPGGFALIREPIVSMGDWRRDRGPGLTKRERGIPLHLLERSISDAGLDIVQSTLCAFPPVVRLANRFGSPTFSSGTKTMIDAAASRAFRHFYRYHATRWWQKFRPTCIMIVARRKVE